MCIRMHAHTRILEQFDMIGSEALQTIMKGGKEKCRECTHIRMHTYTEIYVYICICIRTHMLQTYTCTLWCDREMGFADYDEGGGGLVPRHDGDPNRFSHSTHKRAHKRATKEPWI